MKRKILILFSGGLDSRLVLKILKEKFSSKDILAMHFKMPFLQKFELAEIKKFLKDENIDLKIFDVCRGKLLKEYLELIWSPRYGYGRGVNPCVDCRLWMLEKAKKFGEKKFGNFVLATGEVPGQRPMSQTKSKQRIIDGNIGVDVLRPLEDLGINGRRRDKQISLADKFEIDYPTPSGGCLLCDKNFKKRFQVLLSNNSINEKNLKLVSIGRHFFIKDEWFVVGRNEEENKIIEGFSNSLKSASGVPAVYFSSRKSKNFARDLQKDFSKNGKRIKYKEFMV